MKEDGPDPDSLFTEVEITPLFIPKYKIEIDPSHSRQQVIQQI
jgi:hypothetical protein